LVTFGHGWGLASVDPECLTILVRP
jgi:hypothetical protein